MLVERAGGAGTGVGWGGVGWGGCALQTGGAGRIAGWGGGTTDDEDGAGGLAVVVVKRMMEPWEVLRVEFVHLDLGYDHDAAEPRPRVTGRRAAQPLRGVGKLGGSTRGAEHDGVSVLLLSGLLLRRSLRLVYL